MLDLLQRKKLIFNLIFISFHFWKVGKVSGRKIRWAGWVLFYHSQKKSIFNVLWACASWHSGRQQSSARLLWIFSPQIPQDFRVDSLTLFRPTVSMLHNPYSYSHSFQVSLEPKFTFAYCTSLGSMMKLQTSQHKRSESIFQGVVWKQQLCCQRTCCILFLIIPCMFTDNTLEKKMVCHMVPFS